MPPLSFLPSVRYSFTLGLLLAGYSTVFAADSRQELTDRLDRLERVVESQGVAELLVRLGEMQRELQRLQGAIELHGHEIEDLQKSQTSAAEELNRRLSAAEKAMAARQVLPVQPAVPPLGNTAGIAAPSGKTADQIGDLSLDPEATLPSDSVTSEENATDDPSITTDVPSGSPTETAVPGTEQAAYQQAFDLLKQGRYEQAGAAFTAFLVNYPGAAEADNAQYWLGESNYVRRQFSDAAQAFQTLLDRYPASPKRADAALKLGFIHYELTEWAAARSALGNVMTLYPDTTAATLADNRLRKMTQEGH